MASSLAHQFTGLRCPPLSSSHLSKPFSSPKQTTHHQKANFGTIVSAVAISNAQTKERLKLKELFEEAYERCRTAPMEGLSFGVEDFHSAIEKYDFNSEIGTKVSYLHSTFFYEKLFDYLSCLVGQKMVEKR